MPIGSNVTTLGCVALPFSNQTYATTPEINLLTNKASGLQLEHNAARRVGKGNNHHQPNHLFGLTAMPLSLHDRAEKYNVFRVDLLQQ